MTEFERALKDYRGRNPEGFADVERSLARARELTARWIAGEELSLDQRAQYHDARARIYVDVGQCPTKAKPRFYKRGIASAEEWLKLNQTAK